MEEVVRIVALPGPAGVGGHGCARPGRLLLVVRWIGASGDVYVCERNASLLCLGPTAFCLEK